MKREKPGMILLLQSTTEMMKKCEAMDECMVEVLVCEVEEASRRPQMLIINESYHVNIH